MEKIVEALGKFLESTWGFLLVSATWMTGLGVGLMLQAFDVGDYVNVFNLFLSISALFMSSLLLVAGKKNSTAQMALIEELIKSSTHARNELLGLEKESMEDIQEVKDEIENS